jgi:cobalt-zinc-cadmium efflux system protein
MESTIGQGSSPSPGAHAACVHRPDRPESRRVLAWVLALTLGYAGVEVVGGLVSGALVLLADAAHMVTDAAAVGLSLFAAWVASRPPSANKTYGYFRLEILAALANGVALVAVTGGILLEALQRLRTPQPIGSGTLLAVAALGLLVNVVCAVLLHRAKGESLNVRGAYLHVLGDLLGSVGAIGAGVVVALTGWLAIDPLVSVGIALLILVSAVRLVLDAVDVLLEAAPAHVSLAALTHAVAGVPGVTDVHDLHVWTVSSGMVAMSAHVTAPDLARHGAVLEEVCRCVRAFGIQHVTVQLEQSPCGPAPASVPALHDHGHAREA